MKKGLISILIVVIATLAYGRPEEISLSSPDGQQVLTLFPEGSPDQDGISFSIQYKGKDIILPSVLRLFSEDIDFSGPFTIQKVEEITVDTSWVNPFGERRIVQDHYNKIKIYLENKTARVNLVYRAYNEGVAFTYEIPAQNNLDNLSLDDEVISWRFDEDYAVWSTSSAQGEYRQIHLSEMQSVCERPLVVEMGGRGTIALAEAKLVDYARMRFDAGQDDQLSIISRLDGRPDQIKQDKVTGAFQGERGNKAKVRKPLPFQSPWRVVMIAANPGKLLEQNYIIQNLNDPCALEDISWITPGKALRETTLTTSGGMAAIDFVAAHNMQYVHFDAGWYGNEMDDNSDATTVTLDPKRSKGPFDLERIIAYANEKNVKVMLYVNRRALEKQLDDLLPLFKKWGVAGIKFGFVRVGDQDATVWLHEAIKKAAAYGFVVDVHDEYRPTGFSRTYPSFLTQEGIRGDEESIPNSHTLITMFTRMLAGAADNTVCYYNKRVDKMGSHASQLAKTVCLFSPLQFLYWYDKAPAAPVKDDALWGDTKTIGNEPELEFFDQVPTTWDETYVITAEIGKAGVVARRKGEKWFVGGIIGDEPREVKLDFSFLDEKVIYEAKIYTDDETVETRTRVRIENRELAANDTLALDIKANNGFVIHLQPKK